MQNTTRAAAALLALACACTPAWADAADPARLESGFARHLAQVINGYRQLQGLPGLEIAGELETLADEHSTAMATQRRLSHDGFHSRLGRTTSRLCVENVGWNYPTAETLLDGWRHSPEHLRNLLDPKVRRMGLAARARYVTFFACS
jgi:uncharacterized protein YkwD